MPTTLPPLTAKQAAARLGVTDSYIRRLVLDGRLHATRFGARNLAIDPEALVAFRTTRRGRGKPRSNT